MRFTKIALIALLGGALTMLGCGDDSTGDPGGSGGDGGMGGMAGAGGTGGMAGAGGMGGDGGMGGAPGGPEIFCPPGSVNPALDALFPDGLNIPLTATSTVTEVTQGQDNDVDVSQRSVLELGTISVSGAVGAGSVSQWAATMGGTGTIDIVVPETTFEGSSLDIDAGTGTGTISVDAEATELVLEPVSLTLNLSITSPIALDLTIDIADGTDCVFQNVSLTIPAVAP